MVVFTGMGFYRFYSTDNMDSYMSRSNMPGYK